jgi:hypothetical protein
VTQTLIVVAILAAAGIYLGRKVWASLSAVRRAKNDPGCGPGCGCG